MQLKDYESKLLYWQIAIEGIDVIPLPQNGYEANTKTKKSERLTTFVKEYVEKVINRQQTGVSEFEFSDSFPAVKGNTHNNWWAQATDLGRGKYHNIIDLPTIEDPKKEDIKVVMNAFFPLYRALTEKFNRRPFWHWITRHDEYTAERDSIKALKGTMMSLLKQPSAYVDKWYQAYCDSATVFAYDHNARKRFIDAVRNDNSLNVFDLIAEDTHGKNLVNLKIQDEDSNTISNEFENQYVLDQNKNKDLFEDDKLDFNPEDITANDTENLMNTDDIGDFNDILKDIDKPSYNDNIILADDGQSDRILLNCSELAESNDSHDKLPPIVEEDDALSISKTF